MESAEVFWAAMEPTFIPRSWVLRAQAEEAQKVEGRVNIQLFLLSSGLEENAWTKKGKTGKQELCFYWSVRAESVTYVQLAKNMLGPWWCGGTLWSCPRDVQVWQARPWPKHELASCNVCQVFESMKHEPWKRAPEDTCSVCHVGDEKKTRRHFFALGAMCGWCIAAVVPLLPQQI